MKVEDIIKKIERGEVITAEELAAVVGRLKYLEECIALSDPDYEPHDEPIGKDEPCGERGGIMDDKLKELILVFARAFFVILGWEIAKNILSHLHIGWR